HKPSLLGLTVEEIARMLEPFRQPVYRARQIYKWLHHHRASSFSEMTNLPRALRGELEQAFSIHTLRPAAREVSRDGTVKYLWELRDGQYVESVFIPEERRNTVCISSQVGCALGCSFCATAKMGFLRNLTPGEIVEQVIRVREDTGQPITNVVLMGMGEPFLNYPRVIQACHILGDPEGGAIAHKRITLSTVGIVPRIRQFAEEQQPFSLAISLHAPTQELRRRIMPIADKFPLEDLMDSAHFYTRRYRRKRITFEYVLLEGVNDSPAEARALIWLLSPLRCKLNLIPYNDTGGGFRCPSEERLAPFYAVLEKAPFPIMIRKNRGTDISAACGQLYASASTADRPPRSIASSTFG
ncbi:MAG: 23S rRNA (adenine(2503)-C(2))-methyltransferase RlmN, partial [Calditrichaeota bacterium]